ncbi:MULTISPECIES: oxidoreductase [unclassified Leptolyngbya]|uniref:oxidoreductase n=1 Tax=unclassified Leptolyngbya TaxID=2650499 RepID=UPI0016833448|nr:MULTISPECIES: oxidoreductase [unclassified Leptolyngbya]MBD1909527.1 oxidoreductase [Leptolyngbya sp. FACHB-8]MBD2154627.1 oxidoreductase [Leptolyngbya sp. FACHB-16]
MGKEINVGLVGYGSAARVFHAPLIQAVPELRLKTVVERHSNESQTRYPDVEVVRHIETLLEDSAIDVVVITTPNASHFDLAQKSLLAGKHVVVEKPFTASSKQAQVLIKLARQQGKIISVNHNRRWDGDFLTVKRLLENKLLGRLVEYESHFDRFRNYIRPNAWKEKSGEGSGILFDLGSHLIDQAQVLFGLPSMVTADIRVQRDGGSADDNFELILHYDQLKVTLKAGMLVREPCPRFILHGTEGSFIKYGYDPQENALKQGHTPLEVDWGTEPKEHWGNLITQIQGLHFEGHIETLPGCYQAYYENLVHAMSGRAELAVEPEEARDTIRIIELAVQSNEEKRTVPCTW